MNSPFCIMFFGCYVPDLAHAMRDHKVTIKEMREACMESRLFDEGCGWHETITPHLDLFWFGISNDETHCDIGFEPYIEVDTEKKAEVFIAWADLPEKMRSLLGTPRMQFLMGHR